MFLRIKDHDKEQFRDVAPEIANVLMEQQMIYQCRCGNLHPVHLFEWDNVMKAIQSLLS